jgi:DNA-directed RNA polymerase subunit RPC12/RpoP
MNIQSKENIMFGISKTITFFACDRCGTEWTADSFDKDPETTKVCPACVDEILTKVFGK